MYGGGIGPINVMHIQYSERTKLEIGNQTEKAWDYTRGDGSVESNGYSQAATINKDEFKTMFNKAYQSVMVTPQPLMDDLEPFSLFAHSQPIIQAPQAQPSEQLTKVLMVSNLPEQHSTPQTLFKLFSIYGNVTRVKLLYQPSAKQNQRDRALIEFETPD